MVISALESPIPYETKEPRQPLLVISIRKSNALREAMKKLREVKSRSEELELFSSAGDAALPLQTVTLKELD